MLAVLPVPQVQRSVDGQVITVVPVLQLRVLESQPLVVDRVTELRETATVHGPMDMQLGQVEPQVLAMLVALVVRQALVVVVVRLQLEPLAQVSTPGPVEPA